MLNSASSMPNVGENPTAISTAYSPTIGEIMIPISSPIPPSTASIHGNGMADTIPISATASSVVTIVERLNGPSLRGGAAPNTTGSRTPRSVVLLNGPSPDRDARREPRWERGHPGRPGGSPQPGRPLRDRVPRFQRRSDQEWLLPRGVSRLANCQPPGERTRDTGRLPGSREPLSLWSAAATDC